MIFHKQLSLPALYLAFLLNINNSFKICCVQFSISFLYFLIHNMTKLFFAKKNTHSSYCGCQRKYYGKRKEFGRFSPFHASIIPLSTDEFFSDEDFCNKSNTNTGDFSPVSSHFCMTYMLLLEFIYKIDVFFMHFRV